MSDHPPTAEIQAGRLVVALPPEASPPASLAWSAGRELLAVGSAKGAVGDLKISRYPIAISLYRPGLVRACRDERLRIG